MAVALAPSCLFHLLYLIALLLTTFTPLLGLTVFHPLVVALLSVAR